MINKEINKMIEEAKATMSPEQFEKFREQRKNELVLEMVALRERARFSGDMVTVTKCTAFLNKAMIQAAAEDLANVMQ